MNALTSMALLGVLFLFGGCIAFAVSLRERRRIQQVREHGVDGEAVITGKNVRRMVSRRQQVQVTNQYVAYRFDAQGPDGHVTTYTSGQPVSAETYSALNEGDKVAIRYLAANPAETAELAGNYADRSAVSAQNSYASGCLIAGVIFLLIPLVLSGTAVDERVIRSTATAKAAAQSSATAERVALESADWAEVRAALEPHFTEWKQVTDQAVHQVSPAQLGLSQLELDTIIYGYCQDGSFYVIALKERPTPNNPLPFAYSYVSKGGVLCDPPNWSVSKRADLGEGWLLATVWDYGSVLTSPAQ